MILFDTNILVFAHDEKSPYRDKASQLRGEAYNGEIQAVISPQIMLEFYSSTTSSYSLDTPFSITEAQSIIQNYLFTGKFTVISPTLETTFTFGKLLDKYSNKIKKGSHIFDLYLAATALSAGVDTIYTANTKDFSFIKELEVANPFD